MHCEAKVEIPRSCPIIHPPPDPMTEEAMEESDRADQNLSHAMSLNGLGVDQQRQVNIEAAIPDQCSNRAKPGHSAAKLRLHKRWAYPPNMYAHVQNVKTYQERDRRYMKPNVKYIRVHFGCGGPFSPECLIGWNDTKLLGHRLHLWADPTTHPKPCNHGCLQGWSGADLNTYRRQTWAGRDATALLRLDPIGYANFARQHVSQQYMSQRMAEQHPERFATLDFSDFSDQHTDQWILSNNQLPVRTWEVWDPKAEKVKLVHVPEHVTIPLPKRLEWVLSGSESRGIEAEPTWVETPEMADARRRKARDVLRRKIAKDFPPLSLSNGGVGQQTVVVASEG